MRVLYAQIAIALLAMPTQAATPEENFEKVIASVEQNTAFEGEPALLEYCPNERSCQAYFGPIQVQFIGLGVVDVLTSSQIDPADYQNVCAATLSGLSGSNFALAQSAISQAFNEASQRGEVEVSALGVEIEVRPDYRNLLGCSFFAQ